MCRSKSSIHNRCLCNWTGMWLNKANNRMTYTDTAWTLDSMTLTTPLSQCISEISPCSCRHASVKWHRFEDVKDSFNKRCLSSSRPTIIAPSWPLILTDVISSSLNLQWLTVGLPGLLTVALQYFSTHSRELQYYTSNMKMLGLYKGPFCKMGASSKFIKLHVLIFAF